MSPLRAPWSRTSVYAPCVAYAGSLSFARLTLKTSFIPPSCFPFLTGGTKPPTTIPPLMVRGGVEHSETEGIRKSVFDKVNRNADINPQKGRHLLCTFCPCEKRKQGETSGSAARDKPAVSRTAVYRRFLSCIIFPQNHRYIFSAKKCNETPYNPSVMLRMTAPFAQGSHGWGGLRCRPLHKGAAVGRLALPSFAQGSCGGAADVGFCSVKCAVRKRSSQPCPLQKSFARR